MSSEKMEPFQQQLEDVYQRYRHRSLEANLDDIAETMEETVLQRVLAEEFLQTEVAIDDEAKQAIREAREMLENNEYTELDARLHDLERTVDDQRRRVSNRIQEERIEMSNTVNGMIRLNERVDRVNETKLKAIQSLLDDWDWKSQVYRHDNEGIEEHKQHAADYGRDMRAFYEEAREAIFGPYEGTPLEEIVDGLLEEERLSLADLSDKQMELLRDADLEEFVELKLS